DFVDVEVSAELAEDQAPRDLAGIHPESPMVWATLPQDSLAEGADVAAYAVARTGYHRGVAALRGSGWRGLGPVPASHTPNRRFLRALAMLGETSRRRGDEAEVDRVQACLREADPSRLD